MPSRWRASPGRSARAGSCSRHQSGASSPSWDACGSAGADGRGERVGAARAAGAAQRGRRSVRTCLAGSPRASTSPATRSGNAASYYAQISDGVAFASTLRPLLDGGIVPRTLNAGALPSYLSFGYLPGRETLVEGVLELLPGQHLVFRGNTVRDERIWSLPSEDGQPEDEEVYRRRLRVRLERAVGLRLPDSGPVAATLSGGIDSSVVNGACEHGCTAAPSSTFSLSFGRGIPERARVRSEPSRRTAGTDHHIVELSPRASDGTVRCNDGRSEHADRRAAHRCELAPLRSCLRAGLGVLNGEGGDPCFGGPKNIPMLLHELYGPAFRCAATPRAELPPLHTGSASRSSSGCSPRISSLRRRSRRL